MVRRPEFLSRKVIGAAIASLLAGIAAGLVYRFIGVKPPAPPWPALVGLLGLLAGERACTRVLTWHRDRRADRRPEDPPQS